MKNPTVDPEIIPVRLTPELFKELWTKTYNTDGKPDWSHIFPYYHPNILFQDSIQQIEGIVAFKGVCERLAKRCKQLRMEIVSHVFDGNLIFFQWEMTMMFQKYPSSTLFGCSKLVLHEDGRIINQRDYYDLWGDIFDNIPKFGKVYRKFMKKKFG